MTYRWISAGAMLAGTLFLGGCESRLSSMSDNDLQDKMYECRNAHTKSPGSAISCDNFERECQNRRSAGKYVC